MLISDQILFLKTGLHNSISFIRDPGTESLKERNLTLEVSENLNMKSLLPQKAGPKKRQKKSIDIRSLFARQIANEANEEEVKKNKKKKTDTSELIVLD